MLDALQAARVTQYLGEERDSSWAVVFDGTAWSMLNAHRDVLKELRLNLEDLYSWTPGNLQQVVLEGILIQDLPAWASLDCDVVLGPQGADLVRPAVARVLSAADPGSESIEPGEQPESERRSGAGRGWDLASAPMQAMRETLASETVFSAGTLLVDPEKVIELAENLKGKHLIRLLGRLWFFHGYEREKPSS